MTDYDIEVEIEWGDDGRPSLITVATNTNTYVYTAEELEGTNLLDLIRNEKVTVYSQEETLTVEEHREIYGW